MVEEIIEHVWALMDEIRVHEAFNIKRDLHIGKDAREGGWRVASSLSDPTLFSSRAH